MAIDFSFEELVVGRFMENGHPRRDGRFSYMPYRSVGHYAMQVELKRSGSARCSYAVGDEWVGFTVRGCPEYGVLELAEFEVRRGESGSGNPRRHDSAGPDRGRGEPSGG